MNDNQMVTLWQNDWEIPLILYYWYQKQEREEEELVCTIVKHLIMQSDVHIRIDRYFENWLPQYLDADFFSLFRMTKETFGTLLNILQCQKRYYCGGEFPLSAEIQLLITLWWLGKGEVLLSVADKFNVVVSTVYACTNLMLSQLLELLNSYIVWPDRVEAITVENDFFERCGYPGVIGAIDGCCIKFKAPLEQQDSYIDRSQNHSIKLQSVVTCNKILTNVMIGFPGSAHDARVFRNSNLYLEVHEHNHKHQYFYDNKHLVGDSAYPLCDWLITPYRDNGNLTPIQRRHNTKHSKTRIVVEHTFGILKSRWRILRYINVNSIERAIDIIAACCLLHNFCYIHHDCWINYEPEIYNEEDYNGAPQQDALNKRNEIAYMLEVVR